MQINVLLVDYNQHFLKCTELCLEELGGISVETASSSGEALEKIEKKRPDVIVCEINMPVTTGFEFLKTLRDSNSVPFIMFNPTTKMELALQAFHSDVNRSVGKYGDASVVYTKLKQCIENITKNQVNGNEQKNLEKGMLCET